MGEEMKINLQLFAEGGEGGGDGAASGDAGGVAAPAAPDPDQRLRELGVPEKALDKHRKARHAKAQTQPQTQPVEAEQPKPVTDESQEPVVEKPVQEEQAVPKRLTMEEIMADPEYGKAIQGMIAQQMQKVTPTLNAIAKKYGQDPANIDYDALNKSVTEDDSYYEDRALELGVSVDTARKLDQQKREQAQNKAQKDETLQMQMFREHMGKLEQQGEELKKSFPNFDLHNELKDKRFARLVAPGSMLSVEDAYHVVHRKEIQAAAIQAAQKQAAEKIANDIQAGSRRPHENGTSGQAPSVASFDYRNASKEQREALKREIRLAKLEGRKIYPGQR